MTVFVFQDRKAPGRSAVGREADAFDAGGLARDGIARFPEQSDTVIGKMWKKPLMIQCPVQASFLQNTAARSRVGREHPVADPGAGKPSVGINRLRKQRVGKGIKPAEKLPAGILKQCRKLTFGIQPISGVFLLQRGKRYFALIACTGKG